jgi:SAM-dependent methyltransferase
VSRLEDALPVGNIDLVVSALAVHHLDGAGKADLFARIAARRRSGGRFVLGDVVVPDDPADVVTLIDGVYDQLDRRPGPMACRRRLHAEGVWARQDPLRDRRRFAVLCRRLETIDGVLGPHPKPLAMSTGRRGRHAVGCCCQGTYLLTSPVSDRC